MPDVRTVSRRCLLGTLLCVPWLSPTEGRAQPRRLPPIERILVIKRERRLYAFAHGDVVAQFRVALGRSPRGHKLREGDGRTPEGLYFVDGFIPDSEFYRAIKISYPNREDRERARRLGVDPGGRIMIHGLDPAIPPEFRDSHWLFNWTNGCIAVRNEEMDMLWERVAWGTPVEIRA
jgi:murein L,D-transpeptidase YafK